MQSCSYERVSYKWIWVKEVKFSIQIDKTVMDNVVFDEIHSLTESQVFKDRWECLRCQKNIENFLFLEVICQYHQEFQVLDTPVQFFVSVVIPKILQDVKVTFVNRPEENQTSHSDVDWMSLYSCRNFAIECMIANVLSLSQIMSQIFVFEVVIASRLVLCKRDLWFVS